jgi:hypothetical protein
LLLINKPSFIILLSLLPPGPSISQPLDLLERYR